MGAYSEVSKCTGIDPTPGSICQIQHAPYKYIPTLWVGALFTALFAAAFLGHLVLSIWPGRFSRGGFMLLSAVCAGGEMAGWVARATSHYDFFSRNPYMVQLICLIISPIFISAANYVALERITLCVGTEMFRLNRKVYFGIFVSGDILSLVVQAAGGAISALSDTSKGVRRGSNIALAGVIIQVLITGPFLMLMIDFLWRHRQAWKAGRNRERWTPGVVKVSAASFTSTVFILVRCVYRCAEMKEGWTGRLSRTEWTFCVFDGVMISVALWVFLFVHPGFNLPLPWSIRRQYVPMISEARWMDSKDDSDFASSYVPAVPYDNFPAYATTYANGQDSYYGAPDKDAYYKSSATRSKPRTAYERSLPHDDNYDPPLYDDSYYDFERIPYNRTSRRPPASRPPRLNSPRSWYYDE